jgi:hypothetical protein
VVATIGQGVGSARGAARWLRRAGRLVPLTGRIELLSRPILVEKFVRYALTRRKRDLPADDPSERDPEFVGLLFDFFRMLGRYYFRLEVRGVENIPPGGPALLVGNHNAGLLPADGCYRARPTVASVGDLRP